MKSKNNLFAWTGKAQVAPAGLASGCKQTLDTLTGEIFQPLRLYYDILNQTALKTIFGKLSCVDSDPVKKRWVWLYHREAKSLKFQNSYSDIPKKQRPIVLGSFYSNHYNEMHLDIGSIDRAVKAIIFFDKKIPRDVAKITYCSIYNKLLALNEHPGANFDALFHEVNIEEILEKQNSAIKEAADAIKSGQFLYELMTQQEFHLVETFPVNFYSDGIKSFKTALNTRQTVAIKRWEGKEDFVMNDILKNVLSKNNLSKFFEEKSKKQD